MLAVLAVLSLAVAACAVPLPKDTSVQTKLAAGETQARRAVAEFNAVRAEADGLLDGSILADVEGGSLLDIDQSAYFVAARVEGQDDPGPLDLAPPDQVLAPRFSRYPMWFVAVCRDPAEQTRRVALFRREDSVSPWLMTMAPEIADGTTLPQVEVDGEGAVVRVPVGDDTGVDLSAQEALDGYAAALSSWNSAADELFADDDFVEQTREFQQDQRALPNTEFVQIWSADPAEFALRTAGGGLLVFGTLSRTDRYDVDDNSYVDWQQNADAKAYLPGRVTSSARLEYRHQVLLFVPPATKGEVQLVGQYGGVVDGSGS